MKRTGITILGQTSREKKTSDELKVKISTNIDLSARRLGRRGGAKKSGSSNLKSSERTDTVREASMRAVKESDEEEKRRQCVAGLSAGGGGKVSENDIQIKPIKHEQCQPQ